MDIGGFPFLTQVLKGTLDEVSGQVDGVTIEGIPATDVTLEATDITTSEPYTAGTATIAATLPTASIDQIIADQTTLSITTSVDGDDVAGDGAGARRDAHREPRPARRRTGSCWST